MSYFNNLTDSIGNTPMVVLNNITKELSCKVWAKYETFNPGNSVKDRIGLSMVIDAENKGYLKPGGTIIEGTSGNTGTGLAIAGISRGYKCIFVTTDKQSDEKINVLKSYGAKVIICPTDVDPDDERSYYSVAKRLGEETENSWYVNQYDNSSNPEAHYESTGPEIWDQTDGKVTHFVVGVGTGGTISGVGKFLKERNPNIKIWGVDAYGSVLKKFHETGVFDKSEIYPYITEGIGEDMIPKNINFDIIDGFTKVTDKDAAIFCRELLKQEGMFLGNSAGAAIKGVLQLKEKFNPQDLVVVLFHDHGSRYLKKIYNDEWMRKMGYM
tara:strand:+ start:100 stop:1077 length:978 start_codon:yes stop_codon:yes gene_type:complete